jgi:hypothetical protein
MSQEPRALELITSFIEGMMNNYEILEIFNSIQKLPKEQSLSIIEASLPFIKDVKKGDQRANILHTIAAFPQEQRASIPELMLPLIEYGKAYRRDLLDFLRKLLPQQRAYGTELLLSLFEEIKSNATRRSLIVNLGSIPEGQGVSILELVLPFIKTIQDESQKVNFLGAIIEFPSEHRVSHIKLVISLFQEMIKRGQNTKMYNFIIKTLPLEQRASSIPLLASLFQEIKDSDQTRDIWLMIQLLPEEERVASLPLIVSLFKDVLDREQREMIQFAIESLPEEERVAIIQLTLPWIKNLTDGFQYADLLSAIQTFLPEQRASHIELVVSVFKDITEKNQRQAILYSIRIFPSKELGNVFETLLNFKDKLSMQSGSELIQGIFQRHPSLQESSYTYLFGQLQLINSDDSQQEWAEFIWNNKETLLLAEEHALAQEALHQLLLTAPLADPKNPYTIYKNLQAESLIPTPNFKLSSEEVVGQKLAFNLQALEEKIKQRRKITFGQLPQEISFNFIQQLFHALNQRLQHVDQSTREETLRYIENITGTSFHSLQTNFASDPYLNFLLAAKGMATNPAPKDVTRFLAIMKYVYDQSNDLKEGTLLSAREETLLQLSNSIQNCQAGKSEGIDLAYNRLPNAYRYENEQVTTTQEEKALQYLDTLAQKLLSECLTSEALLKELTEAPGRVEQLSHQVLFLKNRIGPRVGLQHQLKFDAHTHVLYDSLRQRDLAQTLEIFFTHFKIQNFIQALQVSFQHEPEILKRQLYNHLNALLDQSVDLSKCWDMDGDLENFEGLSERGAKEILLKAAYLKKV